jgi:hypothetical protein
MKIIQTFWTGNSNEDNALDREDGWLSPEYNWMSWALSCLLLRKQFGKVELITDSLGKHILTDLLQLPYSEVSVTLDHVMDGYPPEVWALSKIHTYSSQQEPFIHFDGDLFLYKPIAEGLQRSELLVQNKEKELLFYRRTLDAINEVFTTIPAFCKKEFYQEKPLISINAGIIGGNNPAFFDSCRKAAFDFISANAAHVHKIRTENLNFIVEQYFLYCLAEEAGIPISVISDTVVEDLLYKEYVNFCRIPEINFIHPVGRHKKNIHVCDNLSRTLRSEYPEVYDFILSTTRRSGVSLTNKMPVPGEHILPNIDFYSRTNVLIRLLSEARLAEAGETYSNLDEQTVFDGIASEVTQTEEELQLLTEIYQVEKRKKGLFHTIYDATRDLQSLYAEDYKEYARARHHFRLQADEIARMEVVQNRMVDKIPVTHNWMCAGIGAIEEMARYNLSNPETSDYRILLVPKIMRLDLDEYMLDSLDEILFDYCSDAKPVAEILPYMATYFEPDEIAADHDAFVGLILDSLSRLCDMDLLRIRSD